MTRSILLRQPATIALGPGVAGTGLAPWFGAGVRRGWVLLSPAVQPAVERLLAPWRDRGITFDLVPDVTAEPTCAHAESLRTRAAAFAPDVVLGIGGGSVLDVAKVVAALHDRPDVAIADCFGQGLVPPRRTPLVCLPTTAGTGSEVSPNALLVDEVSGAKKAVISPELIPDAALVDATLMTGLPPSLTATTGIDALSHCLEAYANLAAHPAVDLYALHGVSLAGRFLRTAVADGSDLEARQAMADASLYGGLCLGPVNTAAVHALAYPLGTELHLPHGLSIALLLAAVVAFNLPAMPARYAALSRALGADPAGALTDEAAAAELPGRLTRLITECGIPLGLDRHGVTAALVPRLADGALQVTRLLKNNPRPISRNDAIGIYTAALSAPTASSAA